ncbi:hypothetical protein GCM10022234_13570 [Aeromicrobium panaciterrae]|uniref:DUF3352 domain-containing protein n=1 Tax=Aeromicrobium panaciterrae TaxID=363861 RepID=UPI0031D17D8E
MTEQLPVVDEPRKGLTKPLIIVGAAAALVITLAGAGAYAWTKLSGGGSQPHDVLPSSVIAYARVDADPSTGQKIAILKLVRKFPELAKELGIKDVGQDVRKPLLEDLVAECDLDYDKDVEPWLGNRIGVAYDAKLETPIAAVQVSDEDKARTGINKLADCGGPDARTGIAFLDGYALVTPRKADAAKVVTAATATSLADNAAYAKDIDQLGEQGVFSAWVDLKQVGDIKELQTLGAEMAEMEGAFKGVGTAAVTLRAGSSSIELAGIAHVDKAPQVSKATSLEHLPEDTVLALSASGLGDEAAAQFESGFMDGMTADGFDPDEELATLEEELGLRFPEDLVTLLGDGLVFAVGRNNLERVPTMGGPEQLSSLDIGLKLTTDPTKGADLAKRLVALANEQGVPLATTQTDDGVVIATNQEAADSLEGDGTLGDTDNFTEAIAHPGSYPAFYVNLDAILDALLGSDPPPDVEDMLNELEPLSSLGISSTHNDGLYKATMRLTLD